MKEFTVYVEKALHNRLKHEAERTGLTMAALVRAAIKAMLDGKNYPQYLKPKPKSKEELSRFTREYISELLEGFSPRAAGKSWRGCVYLFKAGTGYNCLQNEFSAPRCFAGCPALVGGIKKPPA